MKKVPQLGRRVSNRSVRSLDRCLDDRSRLLHPRPAALVSAYLLPERSTLPLDPPLANANPSFSEAQFGPGEEPKNSLLDLEEDMYEAEIPEERTRLAQAVLRLDPEHIEAHMGLAEHAATRAEGIALLREAVRIGKRTWALAIEASAKSTGGATSAPDSSCGRSWPMAMPWRGQAALSWRPAATGRS